MMYQPQTKTTTTPIPTIFNANPNMSTTHLNVMDLNYQNPTSIPPAATATVTDRARIATQLDSVTAMLKVILKEGRHFADLVDSSMEIAKNIREAIEVGDSSYYLQRQAINMDHEVRAMIQALTKMLVAAHAVIPEPLKESN